MSMSNLIEKLKGFKTYKSAPKEVWPPTIRVESHGKTFNIDRSDIPYDMTDAEYVEKVVREAKNVGMKVSPGTTMFIDPADGLVKEKNKYITGVDPFDIDIDGSAVQIIKTRGIELRHPNLNP